MRYFKHDQTNEVFAFSDDQDHLILPHHVPITEDEARAIGAQNAENEIAALPPEQRRVMEYPRLTDLADALYHLHRNKNEVFLKQWLDNVESVKKRHPVKTVAQKVKK